MADITQMHDAISGLGRVTCILHSYRIAEEQFLSSQTTNEDFKDHVKHVYSAIFEYQASVARYFAKNTLKRLGRSIFGPTDWKEALTAVNLAESLCQVPINALGVRLHQSSFKSLQTILESQLDLLRSNTEKGSALLKQARDVREWISPIRSFQDHKETRRRLGPKNYKSGQWLFEDKRFTSWQKGRGGTLLLRGVVGTGKSSLTSIAIEHLMVESDGPLAFCYCSEDATFSDSSNSLKHDGSSKRNDTYNIFTAILAQLAILPDGSVSPTISKPFQESADHGPGQCPWEWPETLEMLTEVLNDTITPVTLVFDALDELEDHGSFFDVLAGLRQAIPTLRIFFSSRPNVDLPSTFSDAVSVSIQEQNAQDISAYVDHEVTSRTQGREVGVSLNQLDRLKKALTKFADGV